MANQKTHIKQLCVWGLFLSMALSLTGAAGCGGRRAASPAYTAANVDAADSAMDAGESGDGISLADLTTGEPPAAELTDGPRDAYAAIAGVPPTGAAGGPSYSGYYKTAMAFDGNPRTWWAGERNKGTWDLYYGLSSPIPFTQLNVNFYSSLYTPGNIKLYTSADGTSWSLSGQISSPSSKPSFTLSSVSAKYVRIEMTGNPPTGIPIIREIDWLPVAVKPGASAGPNFNDDWYFASNAFDGNPNTWWAGKANSGAWDIFYNFGTPRQVGLLTAAFYAINTRPTTVSLYTSGDGVTWTRTGDLSPEATSTVYVGASVLYMKLSMTGNPPSTFPLIKDIYMNALPGSASPDSFSAFYSADKAFDNKPATLWAGKKAATEWNVYYTFPAPTAVTNVAVHYTDAAHTPAVTDLYTSGDGMTWTNTATFPSGTDPNVWAGATVKYLRFKMSYATAPATFFPTIKDIDVGGSTAAPSVQLKSQEGAILPSINTGDDVYFGMTGLVPGAMYDINVTYPNGASYTLNLSANEIGEIPSSSVLAYDAGLPLDPADPGSGRIAGKMGGSMAGREALLLPGESIKVIVKKGGTTVTNFAVPYVTGVTTPMAFASNEGGYVRNSFVCGSNENVYAALRQFSAGEKVRVYVVPDRVKWNIGDQLNDVTGKYETFTIPPSGKLSGAETLIWTNSGGTCATVGKYDLVIERGTLDGFLDNGDLVDSRQTVGFMVQNSPSNNNIIEQIATDKNYHYRNVFAPNETVYVYMNPKVRSRVMESYGVNGSVLKYVTRHKAVWNAGDSIIDQTAGIEGDVVQWGCYNESLVAVWPAPLTVGDYDIVIDGNTNGVYDPGVDFLDNIDENGQPNYGFRVQASAPPCSAACVDDSSCLDSDPDTVNVCQNPGSCGAVCTSYKKTCDLTVDKVNYTPEQTMTITLTGRNESAADVDCGVEIALKRDKLTPVWNSFDDNIFITIPAGTEVVRTITKFIPTAWAGTDSRNGSDYAIYTSRQDRTRWDKGDNFNTHVKWECPIACLNSTECDDGNADTTDTCVNAGTCVSSCAHALSCSPACTSNAGCDDGNPLTTDVCASAGTCSAACASTACTPACSNDSQCNDGDATTFDSCDNMGTCAAACSHSCAYTAPQCASNTQCYDGNPLTSDTCVTAGACPAACVNKTPPSVTVTAPQAYFETGPSTVNFNASCADPTGDCLSYSWNFGDGSPTSSAQNPTHTFTTAGPYIVTLTAVDHSGLPIVKYLRVGKIYSRLASSASHTCAVTAAGGVKCWGENAYGTLGNGTNVSSNTPVNVTGLSSGAVSVSLGLSFSCAMTSGGAVKCWGYNGTRALGDGTTSNRLTPVSVTGLTGKAVDIAAGGHYVCAVLDTGKIQCWGGGGSPKGELGNGDPAGSDPSQFKEVAGISNAVAITAGMQHTCALLATGAVKCWGGDVFDSNTAVTGNSAATAYNPTPLQVEGITSGAAAISAGDRHTCAIMQGGGVKCWGGNNYYALSGTDSYATFVTVEGLTEPAVAISAGDDHTCAVLSGGSAKCWGSNIYFQIGNAYQSSYIYEPLTISGIAERLTDISGGERHTCAMTSSGGVKCWGLNWSGQLGLGFTTPYQQKTPADTSLTSGVTHISSGSFSGCAIVSGGVKCWGAYIVDESLRTVRAAYSPINAYGMSSGVSAISIGGATTCALTTSGGVKCWGNNRYGSLGNGSLIYSSNSPVNVSGLSSGVAAISTGSAHNCVLTTAGGVKCWGYNYDGQLGNGANADSNVPVDAVGLSSGVAAVSAKGNGTCALTTAGGVKCWGSNYYGQLGNGSAVSGSNVPVDVAGLTSGVAAVATGNGYACALTTGGAMKCWGNNYYGQLGNGTLTKSNVPVSVTGLSSGVASIIVSDNNSCALMTSGALKCWGRNDYGQLGDGTATDKTTPSSAVTGLGSGILSVSAGSSHMCAITSAGALKCWGSDSEGQLALPNSDITNPRDVVGF